MSTITISAFQPLINWPWPGTTATLRYTYTSDFVDSTGAPVLHGLYKDITCTAAAGVLSVPSHTIISTLDALVNPLVTLNAQFLDERGAKRSWQFQNFQVPTTTPTTIGALTIFNQGSSLVLPPDWYLDAIQVQNLINIAQGTLNDASDVVKGRTYLSVAPASASSPNAVGANDYAAVGHNGIARASVAPVSASAPIFVSDNDRRVTGSYNVTATAIGAIGDGTTDNLAILDNLANVTLQVTGAGGRIYFPPGDYLISSDMGFIGNVILEFAPGARLKPANGATITILGLLDGALEIFTNARAGQGTISFLANRVLRTTRPEWWGWSTLATATVNAAAFNACNAATCTMGAGEIQMGNGTYDVNDTLFVGLTSGSFPSVSLAGTNGYVGTNIRWTGSTSGTAIRVSRGRMNYLHDFVLINGGVVGTTTGILTTGPAGSLQTALVHMERVTIDGFYIGHQPGENATNAAADEHLYSRCVWQNCTHGFYGVSPSNTLVFVFLQCIWATCDYGVYTTTASPITLIGCNGGHNTVDLFINGALQQLTIVGWDGEVGERFIQAQSGAMIQVSAAVLRSYTLARADGTAVIEASGNVSLTNVFQGGNFTSGGATGPHFLYATGSGIDVTNCYFPDDELPHIDPANSASNGVTYRFFNNHSIDNNTNAILTRFPDEQGEIVWPRPNSGEVRLATIPLVDMNTATPTLLYTCPFGRRCIITKVVIRNPDTSIGTASYSFGWNSAAYNDVIANATHTELTGPTLFTVLFPKVGAKRGVAADEFKVLMNTLNGVLSHTDIDVYGELN